MAKFRVELDRFGSFDTCLPLECNNNGNERVEVEGMKSNGKWEHIADKTCSPVNQIFFKFPQEWDSRQAGEERSAYSLADCLSAILCSNVRRVANAVDGKH